MGFGGESLRITDGKWFLGNWGILQTGSGFGEIGEGGRIARVWGVCEVRECG